jgi:hypothetical protein
MIKTMTGVAGVAVLAWGLSALADDGFSHCEHNGDGGAIIVKDDGSKVENPNWTIDFESERCHPNSAGVASLQLRQ